MRFGKKTIILIFILLGFLLLQIFINIPNARLKSNVKIMREKSPQFIVFLDLPQQIWNGKDEYIILQFIKDDLQTELNTADPGKTSFEDGKIQNLEVDFVLTGAELNPPGIFITPILDERDIKMRWMIKPLSAQDIIGTVWVYINSNHNAQEKENQRELIFTRKIIIKNKVIFGLKINTIQWLLAVMIIFDLFLLSKSIKKTPVFRSIPK